MPSTDVNPAVKAWRKSCYSVNHGACVEVAQAPAGLAVRDSGDAGAVILISRRAWRIFIAILKAL